VVRTSEGRVISPELVQVKFDSESHDLVYLVTAEVYVTNLMNRNEFRRHCDCLQSLQGIIENPR
jgi:hypothetical protein